MRLSLALLGLLACAPSARTPEPPAASEERPATVRQVQVTGVVAHPGFYPWTPGITVTGAIDLAGGLRATARSIVRVTRPRNGKTYTVAVDDVLRGKSPDFLLRPDDVISVP